MTSNLREAERFLQVLYAGVTGLVELRPLDTSMRPSDGRQWIQIDNGRPPTDVLATYLRRSSERG